MFACSSLLLTAFTLTFAIFRVKLYTNKKAASHAKNGTAQARGTAIDGNMTSRNLTRHTARDTQAGLSILALIRQWLASLRVERIVLEKPTRHEA